MSTPVSFSVPILCGLGVRFKGQPSSGLRPRERRFLPNLPDPQGDHSGRVLPAEAPRNCRISGRLRAFLKVLLRCAETFRQKNFTFFKRLSQRGLLAALFLRYAP